MKNKVFESSEGKQEIRKAIAKTVKATVQGNPRIFRSIKAVTLPGETWKQEAEFLKALKGLAPVSIVGVEDGGYPFSADRLTECRKNQPAECTLMEGSILAQHPRRDKNANVFSYIPHSTNLVYFDFCGNPDIDLLEDCLKSTRKLNGLVFFTFCALSRPLSFKERSAELGSKITDANSYADAVSKYLTRRYGRKKSAQVFQKVYQGGGQKAKSNYMFTLGFAVGAHGTCDLIKSRADKRGGIIMDKVEYAKKKARPSVKKANNERLMGSLRMSWTSRVSKEVFITSIAKGMTFDRFVALSSDNWGEYKQKALQSMIPVVCKRIGCTPRSANGKLCHIIYPDRFKR